MILKNLTQKQAALCKIIWSCESAEEIAAFILTLPEKDRMICDGLLLLLNYEYLDQDAGLDSLEEFPEVERILYNIKEKYVNGHSNNVSRTQNGERQRKVRGTPKTTQGTTRKSKRKNRPSGEEPKTSRKT
tara:strand:- start:1380 stop:1772 length:393 start_codon:yes stop_codon:yes gene_type:complete